jgi:ADP-heptose:LPS heptosyltransferase
MKRRRQIGPNPPIAAERIVVFRALQLGDMLCAVPALRALRQGFPQAHIALIGLPWAHSFVERYHDLIDELIVFPGAPGFPEQSERGNGLAAFYDAMQARKFDLALQLHGSGGPANDILFQLGARFHAGFVQPDEAPRTGCFVPWPVTLPEPQRYTFLLRAMSLPVDDEALSLPISQEEHLASQAMCTKYRIEPERLVIIHPGAQLPSRRWPTERFAFVADALADEGWQIAITGVATEVELTGQVLGAMCAPALHLAGQTTLGGLAALVKKARLVVCNDTGISHIAAALQTRSVVIACGSDTNRWAPLDKSRHRVLADWPSCRPCMHRDCPYDHVCATNVRVETVVAQALAQLDAQHFHPVSPLIFRGEDHSHAL